MPRRRTSAVEDIFELVSHAPWWIGLAIAAALWIGGLIVGAYAPKTSFFAVFYLFGHYLLYFIAGMVLVAAAVSAVKQLLRRRLLDRQDGLPSVRSLSWREFEQLVGEAYRRQGYDVEETGGGGSDGGIDLVLRGHGETVLVQCKQWRAQQVGVDKVRELYGVLTAEGANRGILVTSGSFTNEAQSFKVGKPLILVDGPALAAFIREVRTQPATNQEPCSTACPKCGAPMVLRTARRGANAGNTLDG